MFNEFIVGQAVLHLDLSVIGVVESSFPVRVHIPNSPVRELLNVKVGENDLVWWRLDRVALIPENNLTSPALEPTTVIA